MGTRDTWGKLAGMMSHSGLEEQMNSSPVSTAASEMAPSQIPSWLAQPNGVFSLCLPLFISLFL